MSMLHDEHVRTCYRMKMNEVLQHIAAVVFVPYPFYAGSRA